MFIYVTRSAFEISRVFYAQNETKYYLIFIYFIGKHFFQNCMNSEKY